MNIPKDSLTEAIEQAADHAIAGLEFQSVNPVVILVTKTRLAGFPILQIWMNNRRVGQQFAGMWFWLPNADHPLRHAHESQMIKVVKSRTPEAKHAGMLSDVSDMLHRAAPSMPDAMLAHFISIADLYQSLGIKSKLEAEAVSRSASAAGCASKTQGRL